MRAYALRRAVPDLADDVCAEVWAIVWRRIDDVPDDALPWLYGVARRTLANHRRAERRRLALGERLRAMAGDPVPAPELPGDSALGRALARLGERDREVLLLTAWEDLPPERAAAALGIKPGTFAVRLHRARRRLADELESERAADVLCPAVGVQEEKT